LNATEAMKLLNIEKKFPITKEQIAKAYRNKAKENHPDVLGSDEQMKLINEAHDFLEKHLDKINNTNVKKEVPKQQTSKAQEMIDMVTDAFVTQYMMTTDREKKRDMLDRYLYGIKKFQDDKEIEKFKDFLNKK
jgi:hypothetical protein